MDESRKQFERFLREEHLYSDEELFWEEDRNCYSIYPVHIAWIAWQESRATIEIKLPEIEKWRSVEPVRAQIAYRSRVRDEVIASGIKVKE